MSEMGCGRSLYKGEKMKLMQEENNRNLDVFYVDGLLDSILEQMLKEVDTMTPDETVHFKKKKNLII